MAEGVLKQMQVSQQIVETDAVADNGQRGHQREVPALYQWPDDGFFCMRGAPVQSGRGGHQKCARQYPVPTTVTMVYRRFVDFAQEILPPHSGRREKGELWPEGGPHRRVVGRFSIPRIS